MNKQIINFYNKVDIDNYAAERIITVSKSAKPRRTVNKIAVIASASAAALVIGIFSVFLFRSMDPDCVSERLLPSYDTISKVGSTATGNDALIAHDGLAVAIENAYSNGKTMYIALFGEYIDSDSAPDTLRYSFSEGDGSSFTVNGRAAKLKTKDIILTKSGKLFKGVIEIEIDEPSSAARLEITIPSFEIYSDNTLVKKIIEPFKMDGGVIRAYTDDEEALLNGDNILFIKSIVQYPHGAVSDDICGVEMQYYVPNEMIHDGKDIQAKIFNEDGSEIAMTNSLQNGDRNGNGMMMLRSYDFPDSRNIKVVLYDANAEENKPIQEYDVTLNDLEISLDFED